MKFFIDECVGFSIVQWLLSKNYDAVFLEDASMGAADPDVLKMAFKEDRILITRDKDFGEIIFLKKQDHCGIILLRLRSYTRSKKIQALEKIFNEHVHELKGNFIVISETNVRITKF